MQDKHIPNSTTESIPYGYCHCGCGEKAPLASQSDTRRGWVKGHPIAYKPHHRQRMTSASKIVWSKQDSCYHVHLSSRKYPGLIALVDAEDIDFVRNLKWYPSRASTTGSFYAAHGRAGQTSLRMHRLVMNAPTHLHVDHINGDTLDNRRANLRLCTLSENNSNKQGVISTNTSGYLGVSWQSKGSNWKSAVSFERQREWVTGFLCPIEAAVFRDVMALSMQGEFASLNFPELRKVFTDADFV